MGIFPRINPLDFTGLSKSKTDGLYVPLGLAYTSFTNNIGTVEIGTTVTSVILNWTKNQTLTSQSLDNGIGSIGANDSNYTHTSTFTTNRTYIITGTNSNGTATRATSVSFAAKRYWGLTSIAYDSITSANLLVFSSELSSDKSKSFPILNPSTQYITFAYPASSGLLSSITVNGLIDTSWNYTAISHTNASGYTQDYYIYQSANLLSGTFVVVTT